MNKQNIHFINSIVPGAKEAQKKYGVLSSVTIAQAVLESSWGKSGLTLQANNLFGIKADKRWNGETITKSTVEYKGKKKISIDARFRKYKSFSESIDDHASFLKNNQRYKQCFEYSNGCEFALEVFKAGYATDPHYADLLISLIRKYDLMQYDSL